MPRCIMIPLATQKGSSVSIYNANKGCENIFTVGAGIPNAFKIPMVVAPCSVFQWCSVLNKMAAILLDFQWFGFSMVGTIALAIAITEKLQYRTIGNPNFKTVSIPMCLVFQFLVFKPPL